MALARATLCPGCGAAFPARPPAPQPFEAVVSRPNRIDPEALSSMIVEGFLTTDDKGSKKKRRNAPGLMKTLANLFARSGRAGASRPPSR